MLICQLPRLVDGRSRIYVVVTRGYVWVVTLFPQLHVAPRILHCPVATVYVADCPVTVGCHTPLCDSPHLQRFVGGSLWFGPVWLRCARMTYGCWLVVCYVAGYGYVTFTALLFTLAFVAGCWLRLLICIRYSHGVTPLVTLLR